MNELLELVLVVVALFTTISGLLYVLAVIDPQTDRSAPSAPVLEQHLTQHST